MSRSKASFISKDVLVLLLTLSLSIILFFTRTSPQVQHLKFQLSLLLNKIAHPLSWYKGVFYIREENQTLKYQLVQLTLLNSELESYRKENDRLKEMLNFSEFQPLQFISANVVNHNFGLPTQSITLDVGRDHEVIKNLAVMDQNGLLGKTVDLSGKASLVQLITDKNFRVSIRIGEDRALGLFIPTHGKYGILDGVRKSMPLSVGEIAYTSGISEIYPKNIPVAKVVSIEKKDDKEVVEQICKDGIHILIDLQGHSAKNRLPIFFYKSAPIQASWLAQGSLGIKEVDYFIGSPHITPKDEEKYYYEKILRLPEISQCFTKPTLDLKISELPALKNKFITFGSNNKLTKINDDVILLWSKVLSSIPNSKLILKNKNLENKKIANIFISKFEKNNINKNRLILKGESYSREETLKIYNKIDIGLDPFPFQGNTTTCEAVWMGVPVLTLKGNRYLFHFGESINSNLNMEDWIAENEEEYISKAVKFSTNIKHLSEIRNNLRQTALNSPVFDSLRFSDHLSSMLWRIWDEFENKK